MEPFYKCPAGKYCLVFSVLLCIPGIIFSQLTAVPLTAASFNKDVIAESGLSPLSVTSSPFDGPVSNQVFYTQNFQATNFLTIPGGGLPNSGTIVNGADHWQLAAYNGNNCLLFPPQSAPSTASLTLGTPQKFIQLSLLTTAGNGPCSVNISLHFTDLSTSSYGTFSVSDWFGATPFVIGNLGRVARILVLGLSTGLATSDPRLCQLVLNLSVADRAKTMDRIDITDNSTNNTATVGFFALSGRLFILPIELSSLRARYNAFQNKVELNWISYNTQVQEHFEIQRSAPGSDFSPIGSIVPQNGGLTQSFTYDDLALGEGSGWYYRVKEQLPDGSSSYSNTVFVRLPATALDLLQPGGGMVRLTGGLPGLVYTYRLVNLSGQQLQTGSLSPANGYSLDMRLLPRGLYLLTVGNGSRTQTFRFFRK